MAKYVDTGTRIVLLEDYKREQQAKIDRERQAAMNRINREYLDAVRGKERDKYGDLIEWEV